MRITRRQRRATLVLLALFDTHLRILRAQLGDNLVRNRLLEIVYGGSETLVILEYLRTKHKRT